MAGGGECGHLVPHHPAPSTVVSRQLDVVPGGRAQVGDDDVLLLGPGQGRGFSKNTQSSTTAL